MYGIERPWGVAVKATSQARAQPDLARIAFKIVRMEPSPAAAFAAANDAVARVRQALHQHAIGDELVEGSRLNLTTMWSYVDTPRTFLGYECQAAFAVEATNLDDVQGLLVDLVAAGANEIESVEFDVRAQSDLHAEARRLAVVAAREKAEDYARAAGVRLGAVVHIADEEATPFAQARALGAAGSGDAPLVPGQVVVTATVTLGFALAAGSPEDHRN
jgi:uncharacterized protein YggE